MKNLKGIIEQHGEMYKIKLNIGSTIKYKIGNVENTGIIDHFTYTVPHGTNNLDYDFYIVVRPLNKFDPESVALEEVIEVIS